MFHKPRRDRPIHILVDSTGVKVHSGNLRKPPKNRAWRKLHLVVDANSGDIVACDLGSRKARDAARVPSLIKQIERPLASARADAAYDTKQVYAAIERHREGRSPRVLIPPKKNAKLRPKSASSRERNRNIRSPKATWKANVAHRVRVQQTKPGRNHDVSLQDHHRFDGQGPNATGSASGSQSWLPDPEPNDVLGNARESSCRLSSQRGRGTVDSEWRHAPRQHLDVAIKQAQQLHRAVEKVLGELEKRKG